MASYKVNVGIDYKGKRAEPGDVVSDIPRNDVSWLKAQGIIEPVGAESRVNEDYAEDVAEELAEDNSAEGEEE